MKNPSLPNGMLRIMRTTARAEIGAVDDPAAAGDEQ